MTEDAELLRLYAQEKSEPAFAELVRRHLNFVYSTALRRVGGDAHAAAEVTQSVFIALARRAEALAGRPILAGWLFTCAKNAGTDRVRADSRRRRHEQKAHLMNELNSAEDAPLEWERLQPLLEAALDGLNERDREAVLLRFFEDRSYAEIGAKCSIAADTARMRVDRSLEKLRQRLSRSGIDSTAAALAAALSAQAVSAAPSGLDAAITLQAVSAGAGAVSSPAALLINLMSSTKIGVSVGALIAAFAAGLATVQLTALHRVKTAVAINNRSLSDLANEVNALERAAAKAQPAASPIQSAQIPNPGTVRRLRPNFGTRASREATGKALLAVHPELTDLLKTHFSGAIDRRYEPLYLALNLSPDQIAQFERAMAGHGSFAWFNPQIAIQLQDPTPALSPAEKAQQLKTILGDSGYQRYLQLKDSMGPLAVQRIAGASTAAFSPLTPAQISVLSTVLAPLKEANADSFDWGTVQAQAAAILSPDQLKIVDTFRQQFQVNLALQKAAEKSEPNE